MARGEYPFSNSPRMLRRMAGVKLMFKWEANLRRSVRFDSIVDKEEAGVVILAQVFVRVKIRNESWSPS